MASIKSQPYVDLGYCSIPKFVKPNLFTRLDRRRPHPNTSLHTYLPSILWLRANHLFLVEGSEFV